MLAHERQELILEIMKETRSIRISEIAERFSVSLETARRDLEYLQKKGVLRRVHGGANLVTSHREKASVLQEVDLYNSTPRELLGRAAAEMVEDSDIIFISNGTTMLEFARALSNKKNLTVLTNSISVINALMGTKVTVYSLGGLVDHDEQNLGGSLAIHAIRQFRATKAFMSCGGISADGEVTDHNSDSTLQQLMLQNAEKRFLVADSGKMGQYAFRWVCTLKDFDVFLTDSDISQEYRDLAEHQGVELQVVPVR